MGWFKPEPMELKYGEPIHQMVARAFLLGAIRDTSDIITDFDYHFVGPHGVEYKGNVRGLSDAHYAIAKKCEHIQKDFNERVAAMAVAREVAIQKVSVPDLFKSVDTVREAA